ncbi:hypothetical protein BST61_g10816 [Cercospora zeina]
MLSFQLRRGQVELRAHRNWLKAFRSTDGAKGLRNASTAPASERHGENKPRFSPIARARQKAEADHRRLRDGQQRIPAEASKSISDAQQRKRERWEGRRSSRVETVELKALGVRQDLLEAVAQSDTRAVFRLYNELPEMRPLSEKDFLAIAFLTLRALRSELQSPTDQQSANMQQEIVAFAETLAKDIRRGNIVPSRVAHSHLLSVFHESGHIDSAIKFWTWLEKQDDQHNGIETYTVAMRVLGEHGIPLEELESLYSRALARFPGTFSAYHLSPNAILPDRDANTDMKLPFQLFKEMTSQRLLRGDSRLAYLALDTAFRLQPTTITPNFIRSFLEERPVSEAYTVFAIACRAGLNLPLAYVRLLVSRLQTKTTEDVSVQHRIAALRAMLATTYLHIGATGKALPNILSQLIIATTYVFRLPGIGTMEEINRKKLVDEVLLSISRMMDTFARFGTLPSPAALNSVLMNVAGYGRSKETLNIVLQDFEALNLERSSVTQRTLLAVAGLWDDKNLVEEFWNQIIEARQSKGEGPESIDFFVLSKAIRTTGQISFAEQQFEKLKRFIPIHQQGAIEYAILQAREPEDVPSPATRPSVDFEELHGGLQKLNADIAVLEAMSKGSAFVQDYSDKRLPLRLLPVDGALNAQEEVMREVYDMMTTEQPASSAEPKEVTEEGSQDASQLTSIAHRSVTNFTLSDLRYETWKDLNYLLRLAEKHDNIYNEVVDGSIANSEPPPNKELGLTKEELDDMRGFGLSEIPLERELDHRVTLDEYKKEVMRLRAVAEAP